VESRHFAGVCSWRNSGKWLQTTADRPLVTQFADEGGILPTRTIAISVTGLVPSGKLGLNYLLNMGPATLSGGNSIMLEHSAMRTTVSTSVFSYSRIGYADCESAVLTIRIRSAVTNFRHRAVGVSLAAAPNPEVAVVINENSKVSSFTAAELRKVFAGERRSWAVGVPIKLLVREPGSYRAYGVALPIKNVGPRVQAILDFASVPR
jgi:hypothetical protein